MAEISLLELIKVLSESKGLLEWILALYILQIFFLTKILYDMNKRLIVVETTQNVQGCSKT